MSLWLAVAVGLGAGAMAGFGLLISMASGGASVRATVIGSTVAAALAVLATIWFGWANWWAAQHRARPKGRTTDL
jgi:ABC-type proline/glycine betaine transport system permease subunit